MARARSRLPIALAAAVVVAQAAVILMRPREGVIEPEPVSVRSYFSAAELERARDFRGPQFALGLGGMLVEAAVLVALVVRPPRALGRPFRRPVLAGAAAGAALSVALGLAALPAGAIAHQRAVDVGLSTQDWGPWLGDRGLSTTIGAGLAAGGGALLLGLMRRFPRHWWAPGSVALVAVGAAFLYAGPIVLDPIFNRFTPLPAGQARADVLDLARDAGVDVGEVYEVDASRRTTAANAYVAGLGDTKRVVLYDTLLERFSRDEVRLVVAHELGHVHHRDVPRGLIYLALIAPAALFAVQRLTEGMAPGRAGTPAALPAAVLALGIASMGVTTISNQLSRRVEARADAYSLELSDAPEAFVGMERRLALQNVSDPDPPAWRTALFATHPPTIERIGTGVAFERGAR
ncbi:MAG: M48 family metalloprotease [Solirubrobacteraceae bacterium]